MRTLPTFVFALILASCGAATATEYATWHPRNHDDLCFSADAGRNKDGIAVVLEKCDGSAAQAWARFGQQLRLFEDKCLAVADGVDGDGAALDIRTCVAGEAAQQFILTAHDHLRWVHNEGLCVDVKDGEFEPGTQLQLWTCSLPNENQLFGWRGTTGKVATPPASAPVAKPVGNSFGPKPAGIVVAPYYWNWQNKMTLAQAYDKVGLRAATIAFGLSAGGSNPCGISGFKEMSGDIKAFRGKGGAVILSLGGASGDYVNEKCQDAKAIAASLAKQMQDQGTSLLDFDVEGSHIAKANVNERLLDSIAIVQRDKPGTYVSFTLAADFESGLVKEARGLLQSAVQKGVKVSRVNIMAMDYGRNPAGGKTAGDAAIMCAQKTAEQMQKIWPKASKAEINHAIGITPMIGQNDDVHSGTLPFKVSDAAKVRDWAEQNGIGHLAWWSFERDNAQSGDLDNHSNVQKTDQAFLRAFSGVKQ